MLDLFLEKNQLGTAMLAISGFPFLPPPKKIIKKSWYFYKPAM